MTEEKEVKRRAPRGGRKPEARDALIKYIRDNAWQPPDEPCPRLVAQTYTELVQATGIPRRTLLRALKQLEEMGQVRVVRGDRGRWSTIRLEVE